MSKFFLKCFYKKYKFVEKKRLFVVSGKFCAEKKRISEMKKIFFLAKVKFFFEICR